MNGMVFCRGCGAEIHSTAPACPRCGAPQYLARSAGPGYGFGEALGLCFNRYVQFSGRAPRSEYWYFVLFVVLIDFAAAVLDGALFDSNPVFYSIAALVLFLPGLSVAVRRMHDRDRSGWWLWLSLIPLIGGIILLVWCALPGTREPNRFGPDPLAA